MYYHPDGSFQDPMLITKAPEEIFFDDGPSYGLQREIKRQKLLEQRAANPYKWDNKYKEVLSIVDNENTKCIQYSHNGKDVLLYRSTKVSEKSVYQDFIKNFWYLEQYHGVIKYIVEQFNKSNKDD